MHVHVTPLKQCMRGHIITPPPGMTDLVLTLDEQVQQLLGVDHRLSEVCHETNESRVPLVDNLGEGGGTGRH